MITVHEYVSDSLSIELLVNHLQQNRGTKNEPLNDVLLRRHWCILLCPRRVITTWQAIDERPAIRIAEESDGLSLWGHLLVVIDLRRGRGDDAV